MVYATFGGVGGKQSYYGEFENRECSCAPNGL